MALSYAHQGRNVKRVIPQVIIDNLDELEAVIIGNYVMGVDNFKIVT